MKMCLCLTHLDLVGQADWSKKYVLPSIPIYSHWPIKKYVSNQDCNGYIMVLERIYNQ
jgi:hypothetical protein